MFELVDKYFQKQLSPTEIEGFENSLETDSDFADEVAFYIASKGSLQDAYLSERHKEWKQIQKMVKFWPLI